MSQLCVDNNTPGGIKLFYSPNSPYVRKCRVVAIEKGVADKIKLITTNPHEAAPELWAINPLGTVPALITASGMHLCESPVICKYIDSLSPSPDLMPDDLCVGAFAAMADGIMDAAVAVVMEKRRPAELQNPAVFARKEAAISRAIAKFAKIPMENSPLSIGTIALACSLAYVSFRLPHITWQAEHPALAAWFNEFNKRPSMVETAPIP